VKQEYKHPTDGMRVSQTDATHGICWCAIATQRGTWSCPVYSVIQFVLGKHISPTKLHGQLMEVYGDAIMTMQHVIKCCRITKWCDIMMIIAIVGSAHQDVKAIQVQVPILETLNSQKCIHCVAVVHHKCT